MTYDAIVVGGGLAGLTAAYRLQTEGASVLALEASDRPGGRVLNEYLNGNPVEGGGEWVNPESEQYVDLIREVGGDVYPVREGGDSIWHYEGENVRYSDWKPPLNGDDSAFLHAVEALQAIAADIPIDAPWDAERAVDLDRRTVAEFLDAEAGDAAARAYLDVRMQMTYGLAPSRVSLLYAAAAVASFGLPWSQAVRGALRVKGGPQDVAIRLAERLGDSMRYGSPVLAIDNSTRGEVRVVTPNGTHLARRVVVAMNPLDARLIDFTPELPPRRELLHRQTQNGLVIKMHLLYETPFWRDAGLSGGSVSDLSALPCTFDNTPDGVTDIGILGGFVGHHGSHSRNLGLPHGFFDDAAKRRELVVESIARRFGPEAHNYLEYRETDWLREPYISCVDSPMPPGLMTLVGDATVAPCGDIHWASSEMSLRYRGSMAGAVHEGARAATEVLAGL
ncbi:flavin monoamine oxidase family protein [Dietzia lutea]|uniref:Amine oxidase domain-containing protein n=1 Tax=Dietzia lutea TaxID=546160 RepID=A0A2S1RCR9_9ACTN|nr:NAD(P)/FAD-dependent oxidoreductase [Dietzia lutea]AWH94093.1 hypothetical protein A6035_17185 [Dietzia lutea]